MTTGKASSLDAAIALYSNGKFSDALVLLDMPANSDSASAEILNIAAACACGLGRSDDAERYWRSALRADPGHAHSHNNLGILLHQTRRLAEAETAYQDALALHPDYAEAHYNLGLLYQELGRFQDAGACYHSAVRIRPDYAQAHNNLGIIFQEQALWAQAEICFRQAVTIEPAYAQGHNNLGFVLMKLMRLSEAQASFRQAVALCPDLAIAHNNLGLAYQEAGNVMEALNAYQRAIDLQPDYVEALRNQGDLMQKMSRLCEAEACYRRALSCRTEDAGLHNNLGVLLAKQKRFVDAESAYRCALSVRPDHADALHNLALLYLHLDRLEQAEATLRTLLRFHPDHADGCNSLGNLLQRADRVQEAEDVYRRVLALRPCHAATMSNLAALLQRTRRFPEAETNYRHAISIDPDYPEAKWNLGFLLLYLGRLEEGWPLMEARYDKALARPIAAKPDLPFPQWAGEDLAGKTIVIWPEQGFGDEIQFVRYLPLLKDAGAACVTLVCKAALAPLFRSVPGADQVLADSEVAERLEAHDYWSFILSLPLHCRTTLDTIPARLPYLAPDPLRVEHWSKKAAGTGVKVGLVWKGFGGHVNDANRSLPSLACLAPLWSVDGAALISLQRGMEKEPGFTPESELPLLDFGTDIKDFGDTAAIVSQLDLVICVDTAVAHVAGALGKSCWILLPYTHPDWRWMDGRLDSPWYPDVVRLYRQQAPGDWAGVIQTVASDLATFRSGISKHHSQI